MLDQSKKEDDHPIFANSETTAILEFLKGLISGLKGGRNPFFAPNLKHFLRIYVRRFGIFSFHFFISLLVFSFLYIFCLKTGLILYLVL